MRSARTRVRSRRVASGLLFPLALFATRVDAADTRAPPTGDEKAAAEQLFVEAQALIGQNRFAEACPKLEDSEKRDPGIGTMLYLADCYEKIGRIASAWAQFREAEDLSHKENDARAVVAKRHADALEPRLARLTINVSKEADLPGLVIRRDLRELGATERNEAIPVDPGEHVVVVTAPHKKPWTRKLSISPVPSNTDLLVTALTDAPPDPAAPQKQVLVDEPNKGNTQRVVGLVVGGVGVAGIVVGSVLGISAKSTYDGSNNGHCTNNYCDGTGTQNRHDAYGTATQSDVAWVIGGALLAGGAVLYFTAPRAKLVNAGIAPTNGGARAGVGFSF